MKLLTYQYYTGTQVGVLSEDGKTVYPVEGYDDMNQVIDTVSMNELRRVAEAKMGGIPFEAVKLLAPIPHPKQDIICLGVNYMDHSDIVDSLDYEAELAVVIGRDAKNVSRECAFDYVFGYTIFNDVSARTIQNRHKQWYFGKSMDGFCPMGPWIVTADEIEAPPELGIRSRVNGELRQQSSTGLLIFDVAHVIHELSQGMTLRAGTVISMGTPAGVGMGFDPPKYLKPGDVVECEIDGIGTLKNTVG